MKEKILHFLKTAFEFLFNPRFLLCFGLGWMVTNGWSYILFGIGTYYKIPWMIAVSSAYLAFLWVPFTPEKLVTVAIAIALLRLLFPNDTKTLSKLKQLRDKAKEEALKHPLPFFKKKKQNPEIPEPQDKEET